MRFFGGPFNHGLVSVLCLVILSAQSATSANNLRVVYKWKFLDYAWPDEATRQEFPHYVRENNMPLGIEVTSDKIFITVPRWSPGVAATLNYIYRNDTSESPLLNPYPSWEAHKYGEAKVPELVSVYRVRTDRCGRLWVLDAGREDILGQPEQQTLPALTVYNLTNDQVLRKYPIPGYRVEDTAFSNVEVEDASCEDTFAYITDSDTPALVVYSWRNNDSWRIRHHFFNPDPRAGHFNVSGLSFQWWDALIGLALAPEADGYSTLYFHPLCSTTEFFVSTRVLRDRNRASSPDSFYEFKVLGSRGHNGQGTTTALDTKTGILFHAVSIGNSVKCWKRGTEYNVHNLGIVHADNVTMIMPSDIKIDHQRNIWVLSDRLPIFMFSQLNPDDYNFRIFTGSVEEAVRGTVCSEECTSSS